MKTMDTRPPTDGMETKDRRWRLPPILWLPLIVCGALLFAVDVFQSQYAMISTRVPTDDFFTDQRSLQGFLIKTPGCRIPYMDPFAVAKFVHKEKRPICDGGRQPLVDSNLTSLFFVGNYSQEVSCCYTAFWRREPGEGQDDGAVKYDKKCVAFDGEVEVEEEFVKVTCTSGKKTVYTDFFSFVPLKQSNPVFARKPLNVLLLGIDAVSRLNFYRQMPTTLSLLRNLSAVELLGYNKVADNTFPNLIPVLTGLSEAQLRNSCWPDEKKHFDRCPFLWKEFKRRGFVTAFGEDSSWMGIFNYMRKGFKAQPTDYMWGTFNREAERQIGNSHRMNVYECVGAREVYKVFLDYVEKFVTRMAAAGAPYFALFWGASLSHDFLNKPSLGDGDYARLLRGMEERGRLNDTAVVVMSDHGIRWGGIRQTYQGRMEERLPFLFLLLPDWYKRLHKEAFGRLMRNTRRLTTPFDLHETLKDLLEPYNLTRRTGGRGYSLFSDIPASRSCEQAEIASHWCTCQQSKEIAANDSVVVEGANFAVEHMNRQLEGYAQCANLSLEDVKGARIMTHGDHILNGDRVKDYMINLETVPGNGVFEVTLRRTRKGFEVMGTISRLNLYGKQSACITDFHLKLYCYCKSLL